MMLPERSFGEQKLDKRLHPFPGLTGDGIKVAVVTFMEAEGDVYVKPLYRRRGDLIGGQQNGRGH